MKRLTIWYRTVKNSSALNYIYIKPFNGYEVRMMCFQSKHLIYRLYKVVHFQANMRTQNMNSGHRQKLIFLNFI